MKFISWNVNDFRAVLKKGFEEIFNELDVKFFSVFKKTKMQEGQADFTQRVITNITAMRRKRVTQELRFLRRRNHGVAYGIDGKHNDAGSCNHAWSMMIFTFICAYEPNAQNELKRIDYRMEYEDDLRAYMTELDSEACRISR